ncbi:MAG: outer membrane protein assembly factor BamA [Gemmatimonadales bacterium]|nr:outer membrane protein assembly factor BamA [Gemmatimonadales bacterium]
MCRVLAGAAVVMLGVAGSLAAQDLPLAPPPVDSIVVEGNSRLTSEQIATAAGIVLGGTISYRDVQRSIRALFSSGQFDDVRIEQRTTDTGLLVLAIIVKERPMLRSWDLTGPVRLSARDVRDRVSLVPGRALDRGALARSIAGIDSMYRAQGYYAMQLDTNVVTTEDGGVRVEFRIDEGQRVVISQVIVEGNEKFSDEDVVAAIASKPEGFLWKRSGKYDDLVVDQDVRQRLPDWYGDRGYADFQVISDSLVPDSTNGKAVLVIRVEEGEQYRIGTVELLGNNRYSVDELAALLQFVPPEQVGSGQELNIVFNRGVWREAVERVTTAYQNTGYIYSSVRPEEARRRGADGQLMLDLRLRIEEGTPAFVNRINIVGNDVTHERVIREAVVLLPGQLFNRDLMIRSYQNISNLNFFEQPLPFPDFNELPNGDVDVTFRVTEKRTGNINFGASVGQGTGLGGFLGLEEPNLFGRGKRGRLQWQFGSNVNDFTLDYSDPAIRESRVSGSISLFNSRQRFVVGDLGRRQQEGGSLQLGLPWFGSRNSRIFGSFGFQRIRFTDGSADLQSRFQCSPCSRTTVGLSFVRDTRIGLPFPVGGTSLNIGLEQNGGLLGGTGNYRKLDLETKRYTPLGTMGGNGQPGAGVAFTLGITAKSGFITGDPGGFFTELFSLGGVQFGIPLRGYDEFSITPNGFDPFAANSRASADAFGKAYSVFSVEAGARLSQSLYINTFVDAGNVYREIRQYDPTRLFRSAGFGVALISPLGPIGIDMGYGFDKTDLQGLPAPGWKLHFRLGNFGL